MRRRWLIKGHEENFGVTEMFILIVVMGSGVCRSKLIKLCLLNRYSSLHTNYTSIMLFLKRPENGTVRI